MDNSYDNLYTVCQNAINCKQHSYLGLQSHGRTQFIHLLMTLRNYWKKFSHVIVIDQFLNIIMNTHDYNGYCFGGISKWGIFYYLTVLVVEWYVTCLQFHSDRKWWPPSKKGTLYSTEAQNKVSQQNRKYKQDNFFLPLFRFITSSRSKMCHGIYKPPINCRSWMVAAAARHRWTEHEM